MSVRGGGHSVAGHGVGDGVLMIDLSLLKAVRVDPAARTARAAGGVLLGELDRATQRFGLAALSGIVSHTGIGGLTLGGGLGHTMRKFGLTVDNLRSVDLVTADGEALHVDAWTEPELFWGCAAAAATSGSPPPSSTGCTRWARCCSAARSSGRWPTPPRCSASSATSLPRRPTSWAWSCSRAWPARAAGAPEHYGRPVLGLVPAWVGDPAEGRRVVAPLRRVGRPIADNLRPLPYLFLQSMVDAGNQHGMHWYWRSQRVPELADDVVDVLCGLTDTITSPLSYIAGFAMGGTAGRVDPDATAVGERGQRVRAQHRRRLAAARPGRRPPRRLGPPGLDGPAPAQRRGVRALPLRRGGERGRGRLRRAPQAPDRPQGPLGPGQPVPPERQHPAHPTWSPLSGPGSPRFRRQALDQQQGRAQVAQPGQQAEQRRLVDQRAGQLGGAVIGLGDGQAVEPGRPGRVEVATDADAVAGGGCAGALMAWVTSTGLRMVRRPPRQKR